MANCWPHTGLFVLVWDLGISCGRLMGCCDDIDLVCLCDMANNVVIRDDAMFP